MATTKKLRRSKHNLRGTEVNGLIIIRQCRGPEHCGHIYYICKCKNCGKKTKPIRENDILRGHTKTCGCLLFVTGELHHAYKHGESMTPIQKRSPEYITWTSLRERCLNPNSSNYKYWGAKGVTVCERWDSFENFLEDMGRKPSPKHSIDRIDPYGGYEPSNCRWATSSEQNWNKRRHWDAKQAELLTV